MQAPARKTFGTLHFEAAEKQNIDIDLQTWEIDESLSGGFEAVVTFQSKVHDMPFDDIVGMGAAISMETRRLGTRVWAGIVAELELLGSQTEAGKTNPLQAAAQAALGAGPSTISRGVSTYRLVIRSTLWRLALRTNCRVYQQKSAVEILEDLAKEWDIEIDKSQLKEPHEKYEYRVQYNESDYDFFQRICEDDGITWYTKPGEELPSSEKKKGRELTKIFLEDKPQEKRSHYGVGSESESGQGQGEGRRTIRYVIDPKGAHEFDPHLWALKARAVHRTGAFTVHDFDFRGRADRPAIGMSPFPRGSAPVGSTERHESYVYRPGAAWAVKPETGALSDDRGKARATPDQIKLHAERSLGGIITGRQQIEFETNVLDLPPGTVFAIGDTQGFGVSAFDPDRKMLIVRRCIRGNQHGDEYRIHTEAVFARDPYRPARRTPKPRIAGVQSAVVVGPSGQEIHTDEFGRVRVQFPWDREGQFDEKSSCWMRVSQGWAGGGFGMQFLPRVGHEVLVGFFEGDPDQPVVVGCVYNATTAQPFGTQSKDNWTKSGIKTDSSPHGRGQAGFNEISFQDKKGQESIHIQAENAFAVIAKNSESHSAGSSFTVTVGRDGGGGNATLVMSPNKIELRTKGASIVLDDDYIAIESSRKMCIHTGAGDLHMTAATSIDLAAGTHISLSSVTNTTVDTGGQLLLNCGSNASAPAAPAPPPPGPAAGTARKGAHEMPSAAHPKPEAPGGFKEVEIGDDLEQARPPAAAPVPDAAGGIADAASAASTAQAMASSVKGAEQAIAQTTPSMLQSVLGKYGITNSDNVVHSVFDKVSGQVLTTATAGLQAQAQRFVATALTQGSVKGFWNKEARTAFLSGFAADAASGLFTAAGGVREHLSAPLRQSIGELAKDVGPERLQSAVARGTLTSVVSPEAESRVTAASQSMFSRVGPAVSAAFETGAKAAVTSALMGGGRGAMGEALKVAAADSLATAAVQGAGRQMTSEAVGAAAPAASAIDAPKLPGLPTTGGGEGGA